MFNFTGFEYRIIVGHTSSSLECIISSIGTLYNIKYSVIDKQNTALNTIRVKYIQMSSRSPSSPSPETHHTLWCARFILPVLHTHCSNHRRTLAKLSAYTLTSIDLQQLKTRFLLLTALDTFVSHIVSTIYTKRGRGVEREFVMQEHKRQANRVCPFMLMTTFFLTFLLGPPTFSAT